jgi:translation initiation factor IF-3
MAHVDRATEILARMIEGLSDVAKVEREPKLEGRRMVMILIPTKVSSTQEKKT